MDAPFLSSPLIVRHNPADTRFTLERELTVQLWPHGVIMVPAGFTSDGASTGAASFIYPGSGRRYFMPALVHDFLYVYQLVMTSDGPIKVDRRTADVILRQLMRRNGCRIWTCWIFWAMVRLFGRSHWKG
jgi:hypothetical protein